MHSFTGVVQRSSKRATALGYPTANIPLSDDSSGVYAARIFVDDQVYRAAAFADPKREILEAHIVDFDGDLYNKEITVELVRKIRDTKQFEDDDAQREAIVDDVAKVREYFKN